MFCSRKQQQVGGAYDLKRASEHRDPGACPEGWHGVALAPLLKYDWYCESNYCILLFHSIYFTELVNYHFTD